MARGRFLSRDTSTDEDVWALSDDRARLLFVLMIAHLDIEGRMFGEASMVKSTAAPRADWPEKLVAKWLDEMEKFGMIFRYHVGNYTYLSMPNFKKHQVGLRPDKEKPSVIPPEPTRLIPDQFPTEDGKSRGEVKVKVKDKDKDAVVLLELDGKPALQVPLQWWTDLRSEDKRFTNEFINQETRKFFDYYYMGRHREPKNLCLALRNWLYKALEIQARNGTKNTGSRGKLADAKTIKSSYE